MKYLVLGFFGLWLYYVMGPSLSFGWMFAIKLFTIGMFWTYVMESFSKR